MNDNKYRDSESESDFVAVNPFVSSDSCRGTSTSSLHFDIDPISEAEFDTPIPDHLPSKEVVIPADRSFDLFLFHIHEEGHALFLFCKYGIQTICVKIETPHYFIQFLPINGKDDECKIEIPEVIERAGGKVESIEYIEKKYSFSDQLIPHIANWYVVKAGPSLKLSSIPMKGKTYSVVNGYTATLAENFLVHRHIMGPRWIRVKDVHRTPQLSTCPMFAIRTIDDVELIDGTSIPPFNVCCFSMKTVYNPLHKSREIFMLSMRIYENWDIESFTVTPQSYTKSFTYACSTSMTQFSSVEGATMCANEAGLLAAFTSRLDDFGVDLLASYQLSRGDIQLILERLRLANIPEWWKLGRLRRRGQCNTERVNLMYCLSGRLPVDIRVMAIEERVKSGDLSSIVKEVLDEDRQVIDHFQISLSPNLVNYNKRDARYVADLLQKMQVLLLTLHLSQISGAPWARVLLGHTSHRCEAILLHNFYDNGFVLPDKAPLKEYKREPQYRGALVLEPKIGFYDTIIVVLDFNSLYPSIIREYNICFTTVDFRAPNATLSKQKPQGVLSKMMEGLLNERAAIQAEIAAAFDPLVKQRLDVRQQAIKSLANAIYGYLGYRSSRFPATELAALIVQQGRAILQSAQNQIEQSGSCKAIYGDTDSLMINTGTTDVDAAIQIAQEMSVAVTARYKMLRLVVDHVFLRMLLVNKKKYAALERLKDGTTKLELKGLDMVRRDWCNVTKQLSSYAVNTMMDVEMERDDVIISILNELKRVSTNMRTGGTGMNKSDLVIHKTLQKALGTYAMGDKLPQVAVARRMEARGEKVGIGAIIGYIMVGDEARHPDEVRKFADANIEWYIDNQVLQPIWRLCEAFQGMTKHQVASALGIKVTTATNGNYEHCGRPCIPHLAPLFFNCPNCKKKIVVEIEYAEALVCPKCRSPFTWQYVAARLTAAIRDFIAKHGQGRLSNGAQFSYTNTSTFMYNSIDLYNTLRFYRELFSSERAPDRTQENPELRQYMLDRIDECISLHSFSSIQLSSLFPSRTLFGQTASDP